MEKSNSSIACVRVNSTVTPMGRIPPPQKKSGSRESLCAPPLPPRNSNGMCRRKSTEVHAQESLSMWKVRFQHMCLKIYGKPEKMEGKTLPLEELFVSSDVSQPQAVCRRKERLCSWSSPLPSIEDVEPLQNFNVFRLLSSPCHNSCCVCAPGLAIFVPFKRVLSPQMACGL